MIGNNFVNAAAFLPFDPAEAGVNEKVHLPTLREIMEQVDAENLKQAVRENLSFLIPKHIIIDDIVSSVSYLLGCPMASATRTISTIWATAACVRWANFCKTRSASACRAWSAW